MRKEAQRLPFPNFHPLICLLLINSIHTVNFSTLSVIIIQQKISKHFLPNESCRLHLFISCVFKVTINFSSCSRFSIFIRRFVRLAFHRLRYFLCLEVVSKKVVQPTTTLQRSSTPLICREHWHAKESQSPP